MANTESAAPAIKLFGKTITRTDDKRPIVESPSPELAAEDGTTRAEAATQAAAAAAATRAVLACPRCKSRETKFCYFNNYNVNQPRHFCRSCRRHWTAGGTQRNVTAGAGRRKNLRSSSPSGAAAPEEASR